MADDAVGLVGTEGLACLVVQLVVQAEVGAMEASTAWAQRRTTPP